MFNFKVIGKKKALQESVVAPIELGEGKGVRCIRL